MEPKTISHCYKPIIRWITFAKRHYLEPFKRVQNDYCIGHSHMQLDLQANLIEFNGFLSIKHYFSKNYITMLIQASR